MSLVETENLQIDAEVGGPAAGPAVLLLHGWPDAPRGWLRVAAVMHAAGWRTVTPCLRGSGGTRFLSPGTPRDGRAAALAQDAIDLMDALGVQSAPVVGHDWGARAAYTIAALFPHRVSAICTLALAYQPGGQFTIPAFSQARAFWYQWFMCLDQGAEAVARDPVGFARLQWETWSPPGWYDDAEFAATADSFRNPDWVPITLNAYRSRYRAGEARDPRYDNLARRLASTRQVSIPTLMLQGAMDHCDEPTSSEGLDGYFTGGYRRQILNGVGHFPHREAPEQVADAVLAHLHATQ
ncbi:MAG TPA: alpha/beta hydrolase [Streptosporangiaceae bacterium]|nr:alpha/beta hydrolase [Streptosporangiaceae bacterium]